MANYTQWLRYFRLIVATDGSNTEALDLSDFRVTFHISQAMVGKPCTADIKVYNVSQETVDKIEVPTNAAVGHKRLKVIIEAGYQEDHSMIFEGDLWWKSTGRESSTDTYMQLVAATGDRAHQYAVVNASIPKGATQAQVFDAVAQTMKDKGVSVTKRPDFMEGQLPRGKVMYCMGSSAMQGLASTNGFEWGYGAGGIVTVRKDQTYKRSEDVIILNAMTGLIGRPTVTVDGVEATCLLQPRIDLGSLVQIDNNAIQTGGSYDTSYKADIMANSAVTGAMLSADGLYRVLGREHIGDTRGNDWYTKIICAGVNAAQTPMNTTVLNNVPNL